ncbi:MAG: hypothetical protein ABI120_17085 [Gemmatimonadaceae bacterium]
MSSAARSFAMGERAVECLGSNTAGWAWTARGDVGDVSTWARGMVAALPCREAALSHEIAIVSCALKLSHQDAVDRFLAGAAPVLELMLVTADA